jgi:hypothetical protein
MTLDQQNVGIATALYQSTFETLRKTFEGRITPLIPEAKMIRYSG